MNEVQVSIVIVNYNGKELLKKVLDSVYGQSFKNFEVIVVDNDSSDNSVEFIHKNYQKVKIAQNNANKGYAGANSALKLCNGKYIFFLNNDIELEKDCLNLLVKAAVSNKELMVAPKLVNFYNKSLQSGGTWVSRAFYNGHIKSSGNEKISQIPYMGIGLIDRVAIDMFGYLFDKDYFIYAEDLDLGLRLRLLGSKILFVPNAVVYHLHAATMKKTKEYKRTFLMERNLLTTFFKILSFKSILIYLPYAMAFRVIAILKDVITLRFMNAFARIGAIFWIMLNANKLLRKRKGLQMARKMGDEFILEVFSEKYLLKKQFIV